MDIERCSASSSICWSHNIPWPIISQLVTSSTCMVCSQNQRPAQSVPSVSGKQKAKNHVAQHRETGTWQLSQVARGLVRLGGLQLKLQTTASCLPCHSPAPLNKLDTLLPSWDIAFEARAQGHFSCGGTLQPGQAIKWQKVSWSCSQPRWQSVLTNQLVLSCFTRIVFVPGPRTLYINYHTVTYPCGWQSKVSFWGGK